MCDKINKVIESISEGVQLTKVDLSGAGLTEFPDFLYPLYDCLEELNLGGNSIRSVPEAIVNFTKLRVLFFGQNEFDIYPVTLGQMPSLTMVSFKSNKIRTIPPTALGASITWLILTDNLIAELPRTVGRLIGLRKLMLSGNILFTLPEELANCKELELLRIAANNLSALPDWLINMPKLSWLAYAGNPFVEDYEPEDGDAFAESVTPISWSMLELREKLGEGASGNVYRALWRSEKGIAMDVAVKMFKGETTSDGLPLCEMQATESVGEHTNFATVLGRVVDAPKDQQGLVLPLVDCCPSAYQILGNPPSFATCTRDTFPIGTSFSYTTILGVLQSVASACAHLHSPSGKRRRGIMHGDLYAHNILLHRGLNHVLLTDFGAASFKPHLSRSHEPTSPSRINFDGVRSSAAELSLRLEQLEVRAFGCLVDDMLTFADPSTVLTVGLRTARSRSASLHASEGDSSMRITPPSDIVIVRPPVADSVPAAEQTQLIDSQGPGLDAAKAAMELLHLGMPQDIKTLLDALRTVCCNPVVKERPTFDVICQLLSHFESV